MASQRQKKKNAQNRLKKRVTSEMEEPCSDIKRTEQFTVNSEKTDLAVSEEAIESENENLEIINVEEQEESFFEFVRNWTNGFDRLLDDYDTLMQAGEGKRGMYPKVPQTVQAHEFRDRFMEMITKLNSGRSFFNEGETLLKLHNKAESTPPQSAKAKTVKRIIDARLEVLGLLRDLDDHDLDQ